jgi:hypothetical protein
LETVFCFGRRLQSTDSVSPARFDKSGLKVLSDYALVLLSKLPRVNECPFVFIWPDTKQPVHDPRHAFFEGRRKGWVGMGWVS